jgi:hypothetical protein
MISSVTLFTSITAVVSHKVKLPNGLAPVTHWHGPVIRTSYPC